MMAAASARTLSKVARLVVDTPTRRVTNTAALVPRIFMRCQGRAYGTGGAGFKSRILLAAPVRGSGRVLGCAFLLGGGFGLYQTVKLTLQHHLAEEKSKVYLHFWQHFCMKVSKCVLILSYFAHHGFINLFWLGTWAGDRSEVDSVSI